MQRLQRELRRLQLMVEDLLELSRLENSLPQEDGAYIHLTLEALVDSAWSSVRPLAEERAVQLNLDRSEPGPMMGDQRRLHRAVLNRLDTALRDAPNDTSIDVEVVHSGGWWMLTIRDHGPGLSESDLSDVSALYRGDPPGSPCPQRQRPRTGHCSADRGESRRPHRSPQSP